METLRKFVWILDSLGTGAARGAKWLILCFIFITLLDVGLRYFFQAPTLWARELVGLLFGPMWILTGAHMLSTDEQVRMDLVYHRFSIRKKAVFDLITFSLFFFLFGTLAYYGWSDWWECFVNNEHSRSIWKPVVWPFKLALPVGISLLLLSGIAKYIRDLYVAITGRNWNGN